MAWETSERRKALPPDWPKLRARVLYEAGGRCESLWKNGRRCTDKAVAVDHVIPHAEGGTDDRHNLKAICEWHHAKKSSAEGARANAIRLAKLRKSIQREPEKHPGSISFQDATPRANRGF